MPDYLISLPPGYTIKAVLDSASNVQVWVVTNGETLAGSIVGLEWLQIVEWFPPDTPPPVPTPDPVTPRAYRLKYDRNLRVDADLQSALVFTVPSANIVRVLTNDKPQADGLVWRRVEYGTDTVYQGWLAVCNVGDADGVGSWLEALESAG